MEILAKKSSSVTKHISGWMALLTSKIAEFEVKAIHSKFNNCQGIQKNWLFGMVYGLVASLVHFSSKMMQEPKLLSMEFVTEPWLINFCF